MLAVVCFIVVTDYLCLVVLLCLLVGLVWLLVVSRFVFGLVVVCFGVVFVCVLPCLGFCVCNLFGLLWFVICYFGWYFVVVLCVLGLDLCLVFVWLVVVVVCLDYFVYFGFVCLFLICGWVLIVVRLSLGGLGLWYWLFVCGFAYTCFVTVGCWFDFGLVLFAITFDWCWFGTIALLWYAWCVCFVACDLFVSFDCLCLLRFLVVVWFIWFLFWLDVVGSFVLCLFVFVVRLLVCLVICCLLILLFCGLVSCLFCWFVCWLFCWLVVFGYTWFCLFSLLLFYVCFV